MARKIKVNIKLSDSIKRHGNCVPCIVINVKKQTVAYSGSINECAKQLRVTRAIMYNYRKSGKLIKNKYKVSRVGFSSDLTIS